MILDKMRKMRTTGTHQEQKEMCVSKKLTKNCKKTKDGLYTEFN